jgi:hypothetical protein
MTNQHPVTPPPDKIHNWLQLEKVDCTLGQIITIAAQWGADQELEACVEWLEQNQGRWEIPASLRAARRPKPPSLKEQALKILSQAEWSTEEEGIIRRALEALPDD